MSALLKPDYLSVEDYLFYEQDSPVRHEYVYGELRAMAGASDMHNEITGNLFAPLYQHLLDHACRPYANDMKVQADAEVYYYPDVVVACDKVGTADPYYRREPVLIVEVASPKTEAKDRREKLEAYKSIPSLKEYVIVAQDEVSVHLYRRVRNGTWQVETYTDLAQEIELKSVGLRLPLAQIYRRVKFPLKAKRKRHPNAE